MTNISPDPATQDETMKSPGEDPTSAMNIDELQLRSQGHVGQLPRQFSIISLIAFAFSIMNSWIGFVSLLLTTLTMGGPTVAFWGAMVACAASTTIAAGLAELASAFPSSGGQYHFAFMVSPAKYGAAIAFITGWLSILAYLFTTASGCLFIAESTIGLAEIYHPTYIAERWHTWIVYSGFISIATLIVTAMPSSIPKTQSTFFWTSLLGVTVITITCLAVSPSKQSGKVALASYQNDQSGWPTGISFMLVVGQSMWSFTCVDSATHVAEEIPSPGKNVPRAMLTGMLVGLLTMIAFSLGINFSVSDFSKIADCPTPMYEAYLQATQSEGAAAFFTVWLIFIYFGALLGLITTSGRLIWAFSRDNGLPFSWFFGKINENISVPVNANLLACTFCILYGIIYIGSEVAFNVFISSAILFLNVSYTIPQASLLFRGKRDYYLPARQFSLGKWFGPFCNAFSIAWMSFYTIIFCFPLSIPTNATGMNYVSVIVVAAMILISLLWFGTGKRKSFTGPIVEIDAVQAVNIAAAQDTDGKLDEERAREGLSQTGLAHPGEEHTQ